MNAIVRRTAGRPLRRAGLLHALVVGALLLAFGAPAAYATDSVEQQVGPPVVYGSEPGPIAVRVAPEEPRRSNPSIVIPTAVGVLDVPAGKWVVWAQLMAQDASSTGARVGCTLSAEDQWVSGERHNPSIENHIAGKAQLVLHTVHDFGDGDGGTFRLSCASDGGQVSVTDIRMVAYRASRLAMVSLADGGNPPVGPAVPTVVYGHRDDAVWFASTPTTVGKLRLGRGRWWIRATAQAQPNSGSGRTVTCRLLARRSEGGVAREQDLGRVSRTRATLVLEMTHDYTDATAGLAEVACASTHTASISNVRVMAVRLGRLKEYSGRYVDDSGSGWPYVLSSSRPSAAPLSADSRVVATFPTPSGRWLFTAKVMFKGYDADDPIWGTPRCWLMTGNSAPTAPGQVVHHGGYATVGLMATKSFAEPGATRVLCRDPGHDGSYQPFEVSSVRVTAMRAQSLTADDLGSD